MGLLQAAAAVCGFAALASAQTAVTINTGTTYQTMDGFGFSQAFGRANELKNVKSTTQKQALDLLFSTTSGAGFSIIRNRIGSGGSGDSILPTSPGSPSGTPKYVWDGNDSSQVWFSKQAVSYGVKTIYADAWSAPGFMKTSGSDNTAGFLCGTTGHTCSSGDWRQAYANFLTQYIKYYAQEGITVSHVGFLNEPDYTTSYSNMQISSNAQEAISFIPTLSNTLKSNGLSSVKITCCDAVGWGSTANYVPNLISSGAIQYLGAITSHSYSKDATLISGTNLPKWNTEAGTGGSYRLVTTWYSNGALNEGFTWAKKLADAVITAQLSAYLYWEGYETNQQQSGSHLIDSADGNTITISGIYYAFAMWSRYIRPGAQRLGVTGTIGSTQIAAFKNTDGSYVAVFTNSGTSAQSAKLSISGLNAGSASAWVTANGSNFASTSAALSGGAVTVSVPAHGVVTVKLTTGGTSNPSTTRAVTTTQGQATTARTTTRGVTTSQTGNGGNCAALYAQCGGSGFTGPTCCASGSCKFSNEWYSQCL